VVGSKFEWWGQAEHGAEGMMSVRVYRYGGSAANSWNASDMISVGVSMWERLYAGHNGGGRPVFVALAGGAVFGRIQPDARLNWEPGRVEIPEWMWLQLGAPDSGAVLEMERVGLHDVGAIVLRPRRRATLEGGGDLVATLTAELSNGRWAVLVAGMELTLQCGVFDVLRVRDLLGLEVSAGCILNQDVTVELEAALDAGAARRPATPPGVVEPAVLLPEDGGTGMSFPGMEGLIRGGGSSSGSGFQPFSGTGRRL
jgi:hypothetical protein